MAQTIIISPRVSSLNYNKRSNNYYDTEKNTTTISLSSSSIKPYKQTSPKEFVSTIHTREPPVTRSIVPIKVESQESRVKNNLSRFNSSLEVNSGLQRYISPKNRNTLARYDSSDSKVSLDNCSAKKGIFKNFFDQLRREEKKINMEIKRRSETPLSSTISSPSKPFKPTRASYSGRNNTFVC
ncbi:9949_t:CDS:1 [Ambispora leptoticha]|uniref:9949_t:CDS:1 n=1 Tax=Ambispora leptoticha TaxID=144679 RepID=A0A9N9AG76_9GLOM|nr:9949_t:CDS:1 [Ambispora leptoticha]